MEDGYKPSIDWTIENELVEYSIIEVKLLYIFYVLSIIYFIFQEKDDVPVVQMEVSDILVKINNITIERFSENAAVENT